MKKLELKLKSFIHQNNILDKIAFSVYGLFWLIRAKYSFKKLKNIASGEKRNKKILILAIRTIPSTNLVYFDAVFGHGLDRQVIAQHLGLPGCIQKAFIDTDIRKRVNVRGRLGHHRILAGFVARQHLPNPRRVRIEFGVFPGHIG